jgi:hypothetical protein
MQQRRLSKHQRGMLSRRFTRDGGRRDYEPAKVTLPYLSILAKPLSDDVQPQRQSGTQQPNK